MEPHRVYRALLRPLVPGARFGYRVLLDGGSVFQSSARARKGPGQASRAVVWGDVADGHAPAQQLARQVYRQHPDLVVIPGDIVYAKGRICEYRRNFFPVLNAGPDARGEVLDRFELRK